MGLKQSLFLVACIIASVLITLIVERQVLAPPATGSSPLTSKQADAMLNQLTEVRKSLQRIERNQAEGSRRPEAPVTSRIPTKGRPTLGDADAAITVVEFTDYQCPFCSRFATTTFDRLRKEYIDSGKLRWVVLDMPLSLHKEALTASRATHCAGEQDSFWTYRKQLYRNQGELVQKRLVDYARQSGLDMKAFDSCMNSDRYSDQIRNDMNIAQQQRITGTPTFVIGRTTDDVITGNRIIGARPYQSFSTEIDRQLGSL